MLILWIMTIIVERCTLGETCVLRLLMSPFVLRDVSDWIIDSEISFRLLDIDLNR
jgi:hypothetical protein